MIKCKNVFDNSLFAVVQSSSILGYLF